MQNTVLEKTELLYQITALDFKLTDLNLYLDTHPHDMQAICLFHETKCQCQMLKNVYECNYGSLTCGSTCPNCWTWLEEPWPWDRQCDCK